MAEDEQARHLDDEPIGTLKRRAARHGRSSDTEPEASFESLAAELRALTRRRHQTPSEDLLRQGREER